MTRLGSLTWPDVAARASDTVLAVPLGSTEQHGPHLPLSTDTDIAAELCRRLSVVRPDVVVAPPIPYGSSGEHAGFPGTLSIGHDALSLVLVELVRSADAFAAVVIVSAHGGNAASVRRAVHLLTGESRRVLAWSPTGNPSDTHAGWTETSVALALDATSVQVARAEVGVVRPLSELMPALRAGGVAAVSPNGVLGDPSDASAESGRALLEAWTQDLVAKLDGWP